MGLAVGGLGTILGGVNMITTVRLHARPRHDDVPDADLHLEHPGDQSILVLLAFPLLTAALFGLAADRHLGAHVYDPANGGVLLWQHLFWFFGHPEVYIIALPFFGIVSRDLPGVQPQADLRLHHADLRDAGHRRAVGRGVGAPHVRHRRGAAAVLLAS